MWLFYAFISAFLLGFYDVFKKKALAGNAVIPTLFLTISFSAVFFLPFIVSSYDESLFGGLFYQFPPESWIAHKYVVLKSFIVLSSWIFGYFAMKNLPITFVGPINATRPVMVLVGAVLFFGERLNVYQWIGVLLSIFSLFLLGRTGKREGIYFKSNKWVLFLFAATVLGAVSGLYDKYVMQRLNPIFVQSWFNVYQFVMMGFILLFLWFPHRKKTTKFHWRWSILCISIFLSVADFFYYRALACDGAMISIVSMVRRSSVMVSFIFAALVFKEKNIKSKAIDLIFIAMGMLFLYLGQK